jgi:hypothetical protein
MERRVVDYDLKEYAFRFANRFVNVVWRGRLPPVIGRRVELTTDGRCGGMSFASLDFFHRGTRVPPVTANDFPGLNVPPDGHPLADYIYSRQLRSIMKGRRGARDGLRFIRWSRRSTDTVVRKTRGEIEKLVELIDAGEPAVLGLIKATNAKISSLGDNHQVVCYGYRSDPSGHTEFLIYDPNEPYNPSSQNGYEVVLARKDNFERATFPYQMTRPHRTEEWRGFFVQRYRPRRPYRELLVSGGTTDRSRDTDGEGDGRGGPGSGDTNDGSRGGPPIDRGGEFDPDSGDVVIK